MSVLKQVCNPFFRGFQLFFMGLLFLPLTVLANQFAVGERVMVAYPANNIKDDAYIIGLVRSELPNGDYQISVLDYVKGHDYGLSCVPIKETGEGEALTVAWELWKDKTHLFGKGMQYQVKKEAVLPLQSGQFQFIERNNLFVIFSRWRSNAPIMPTEYLELAIKKASEIGLTGLVSSLKLAIKDRASYYDPEYGRPYWPHETVPKLNDLLGDLLVMLDGNKDLDGLWRNKPRNWQEINNSTELYFLVDTLDKIVEDAAYQVTEDGMEKVEKAIFIQFKQRLTALGVKY